jgi:hypothetical protein
MRSHLVVAAVATSLIAALAPGAALAGGGGGNSSNNGAILVLALATYGLAAGDAAMLISDGVITARDEHPSNGPAVGEMILASPTTAIGITLLGIGIAESGVKFEPAYSSFAGSVTAVGLLMGTHAVWTFATEPETTQPRARLPIGNAADRQLAAAFAEPPPRLPAYQLTVTPTVLTMRDRLGNKVAPGVGALLRF